MEHDISVSFRDGERYRFRVTDADTQNITWEDAQQWIDEQYVRTGGNAPDEVRTALLADKILRIATVRGAHSFADGGAWASQFARCAGRALGRIRISVDVARQSVGV